MQKNTWKITCDIEGLSAFVYLDDHLVCQGGNDEATWGKYRPENLVPWVGTPAYSGLDYFLRVKILHKAGTPGTAKITVKYTPVRPNKPTPSTYIGCFIDMVNHKRDLPVNAGDEPSDDSPDVCSAKCSEYKYFGLQDGDNCFCGNSYGSMGSAPASDCNMPCPGDHKIMCGAADRNSIYSHQGSSAAKPIPASSFSDTLQPAQMQRLNMSRGLVHGRWSTWAKKSVTAHILLPTGLMLKFGVCQRSSGSCKEDGTKGDIGRCIAMYVLVV